MTDKYMDATGNIVSPKALTHKAKPTMAILSRYTPYTKAPRETMVVISYTA